MAEIKNSFTSSKMNQDLDDRLVPSNEYREGRNISIISSENSNTGAIQNITGNELSAMLDNGDDVPFEVIGYLVSQSANAVYVMVTNYTDASIASGSNIDIPQSYAYATAPSGSLSNTTSKIIKVDLNPTNITVTVLVSGLFLNFSTTHPITGINLVENLLFWTDNRNQPRKINVDTAFSNPNYYSNEEKISVAKYAPIFPVQFIKEVDNNLAGTMHDVVSEFLPDGGANPFYNENYAGDSTYLTNKFVRFSYRFRFDDGEYSILAPFSQIAFIPQQDGSFLVGDEDAAYRSSIIEFMNNKVNEIELIIPFETAAGDLKSFYNIEEIDIVYKESDSLASYILDTIFTDSITTQDKYYSYNYQSRKPRNILANNQVLRVYDKTPVRALAQEVSGGRVIYGNYIDKHTAPKSLNYQVGISDKGEDMVTEYPLHTVKQNRNYQIGVILSDKFGRQSDIILSPSNTADGTSRAGIFFGGSSFYVPYMPAGTNVFDFVGNSIKMLFESPVSSVRDPLNDLGIPATGEPGLYLDDSYLDTFSTSTTSGLTPGIYNNTPAYVLSGPLTGIIAAYFDVIVDVSGVATSIKLNRSTATITVGTIMQLSSIPYNTGADKPIITTIGVTKGNPVGWYSYKIVVKQTQQEYYNIYTPGALAGYPTGATFPIGENSVTSHISLFSDNINKVPRDLSEVGPDQKQYRSSVQLFGRVQNNIISSVTSNTQFFPTKEGFSVPTLANASDLGINTTNSVDTLYQINTNPIISRISTNGIQFGVTGANNMEPFLSILETNPVVSNIDIYWETSSVGIISELNKAIAIDYPGAYAFNNIDYVQYEDQNKNGSGTLKGDPDSPWVTDFFYPVKLNGDRLASATINALYITNHQGTDISNKFECVLSTNEAGQNQFRIKIIDNFYFNPSNNLNLFTFMATVDDGSGIISVVNFEGAIQNIAPSINNQPNNTVQSGIPTPYTICTFTGVNGSFGNVPATGTPTSTTTSDLVWSFSNNSNTLSFGSGTTAFSLTINPSSGVLQVASGNPTIEVTPVIQVKDSGQLIDTYPFPLDFRPGEFSPVEFNVEFNL